MSNKKRKHNNQYNKQRSKQTEQSNQIVVQLGNGWNTPSFNTFSRRHEDNEAVASCLQTNAMYCSKAEFYSVLVKADGEQKRDFKSFDKLLQLSPNPLMTASVFWERVAYFYFKYSNAFIYVEKNAFGDIIALWSIDPSSVRFQKISTGEIILTFVLNGQTINMPYSMIIHIARNVTGSPLFGTPGDEPLRRVVNLIETNYTGIEKAIMTSAFIRFIGKYSTRTNDTKKEEDAKKFTDSYLNPKNGIGIVMSDSSLTLEPITPQKQDYANYPTMNAWNQAVYKFYGCPENVIAGKATEAEMIAYYEKTIDTFLERVAEEATRKIFTDGEYAVGNRIRYSDRKLQYLPMQTRLNIFHEVRELGAVTLGVLCDLVGLPVAEGKRNEIAYSQNYTNRENNTNKSKKKVGDDNATE